MTLTLTPEQAERVKSRVDSYNVIMPPKLKPTDFVVSEFGRIQTPFAWAVRQLLNDIKGLKAK